MLTDILGKKGYFLSSSTCHESIAPTDMSTQLLSAFLWPFLIEDMVYTCFIYYELLCLLLCQLRAIQLSSVELARA